MKKEEYEVFMRVASHLTARRRKLRLILNAMDLTALSSIVTQMGEAELADLETLLETSGEA